MPSPGERFDRSTNSAPYKPQSRALNPLDVVIAPGWNVRDYVHKGSKLYIEGKLQTQSWEKDGVKHYKTVILVNDLGLLDGKPDASAAANGYQKPAETEIDDSSIPF